GQNEELLSNLQSTLQYWHEKQSPDQYMAAMYVDRAGMPLVAIDFNGTVDREATEHFVGSSRLSEEVYNSSAPRIRLDPSVTSTWSVEKMQAHSITFTVQDANGAHILRSVYPVLDRKTKEINGYVSTDRPLNALFPWRDEENETLLIVDSNTERLVFDSSSSENAAQPLDETHPYLTDAEHKKSLEARGEKDDVPPYTKAQAGENELLVVREVVPNIGWEFFHITHLSPYINEPKMQARLLVASALIFLTVAGVAIYTLTRRIQSRSQQLEETNLQLEEANSIVSQHNQLLEEELQTAHEMQMRLMPQKNPQIDGYEVVGRCRPATAVGGDFFQYFNVEDKKWIFTLADVTGHGMQAAVPTMVFSGLLDTEISYSAEPETLMPKLNDRLYRVLEPRTFVCLSLGELDCAKNTMRISNGGCPYPYFYKASDQSVDELNLSAFPLGVRDGSTYEVLEVPLDSGDVIVFCSDGIIEAAGKGDELFGFERVARIVGDAGIEGSNAEQIIDSLFSELDAFSDGYEQDDDQTIVVVRAA
ncbi:MAG: PP2C family protein-serine/threonine phosphatase, partial [Candidatus Latescibacterota bacterium]